MTGRNDLAALAALVATLKPGDRYQLVDHDYCKNSGPRTVTKVDGKTLHSATNATGRQESYYNWPDGTDEGRDFEVEGRTLKIFKLKHAYVGGRRAIILEFRF